MFTYHCLFHWLISSLCTFSSCLSFWCECRRWLCSCIGLETTLQVMYAATAVGASSRRARSHGSCANQTLHQAALQAFCNFHTWDDLYWSFYRNVMPLAVRWSSMKSATSSADLRTIQLRYRKDQTTICLTYQRKFRSSNFRLYWKLPVGRAASMLDSRDVLQRRCETWEILAGRNGAKCCVFP